MKKCIDYSLIHRAIEFYTMKGFVYVDAEWTAPKNIMGITMPPWVKGVDASLIGPLVGSGEQYFLNEMYYGRLKPGRYCCATPCFRDDKEDELHGQYFFKVELIDTESDGLMRLINTARDFFYSEGIGCSQITIESDHEQYDLIDNNFRIELGSYGARKHDDIGSWLYGTGVAEPRFSIIKGKKKSL